MDNLLQEIKEEARRARSKFPAFNSGHEGFAVLLEEVDELWDEIKSAKGGTWNNSMREEAIQVAAMAVQFVLDLQDDD